MTNVYGYYALMNAKYGVYIGHDGGEGIVVQHGDERQGGQIIYYRAA